MEKLPQNNRNYSKNSWKQLETYTVSMIIQLRNISIRKITKSQENNLFSYDTNLHLMKCCCKKNEKQKVVKKIDQEEY